MSEQSCFSQFSEEYSRISELVWDQLNGDDSNDEDRHEDEDEHEDEDDS